MPLLHSRVEVRRRRWMTPTVEVRAFRASAPAVVARAASGIAPVAAHRAEIPHGRVVRRVALPGSAAAVTSAVFGFGAPVRRELAARASPAVAVSAALPLRSFDQPVWLRRLFRRDHGPCFLDAASPEARLVEMLRTASVGTAEQIASDLCLDPRVNEAQRRYVAEASLRALGHLPLPEAWGEDAAVDALRGRLLRQAAADPETRFPSLDWTGFLHWAGTHLDPAEVADLPGDLVAAAVASLARVHGQRTALEALLLHTPAPWNESGLRGRAAVLALRCALDGVFLPAMLQALLPRGREAEGIGLAPGSREGMGPRLQDRALSFLPAVLAWEAYRDGGPVAGFVHFTAALVSADLRARLRALMGKDDGALLPRVVSVLRSGTPLYFASRPGPWQASGGGPDGEGVLDLVAGLMPQRWMAAEVFLDARLAVAAVYALLGYVPSARAQAQGASPPAMLEDARASLLRALEQPLRKTIEVGALPARPLGPDARRLLDRLRSTPEPSLALGAPFWLLPDRGAIITRLVREGRRAVASSLRNLLDRPDVRQDVEPFWLLHEADTKALQQLALRLAPRLATEATERQCLALLERWCRECSPEERVIGEGHGGQG